MTADEFKADPERRAKLTKVLRDPVLKEAIAILVGELEPRIDLPATLSDDTVASNRYHHLAGALHLAKGLPKLADAPPVKKPLLKGRKLRGDVSSDQK